MSLKAIQSAFLIISLLCPTVSAQTGGGERQELKSGMATQTVATPPESTDRDYRLGTGDLIEIAVFGVEKLRQTLRINADGIIKMPLLEPIVAAGLTPTELEERLTAALKKDLIRNPQVTVFVHEYRSQTVAILGAVKSPGEYHLTQELRLIDVLSMAGGLLPSAVDTAEVRRPTTTGVPGTGASSSEDVLTIDLEALLGKGDLSLNVPVRGGDVIHIAVRQSQVFYVVGEVNQSGAFQLPPKPNVRVTQALASAGGPKATAKAGEAVLLRFDSTGKRQQLPINFSDILHGKQPDILVRADDVIFVPSSNAKAIGAGLLAAIPSSIIGLPFALASALIR
jgi:polysaccharide export outer membrane protein